MRAVLDANVLVSGIVGLPRGNSVPGEILRRWYTDWFELALSTPILSEAIRTLTKSYFSQRVAPVERQRALTVFLRRATIVVPTVAVRGVATHPEDDLVLSTAFCAGADYLVTGDKQLQALGNFQGVAIVSPRDFLDLLNASLGTPG